MPKKSADAKYSNSVKSREKKTAIYCLRMPRKLRESMKPLDHIDWQESLLQVIEEIVDTCQDDD